MAYAMKRYETKDGPLVLEFDFIPSEPTMTQLEVLAPHNCDTCAWKSLRNSSHCGLLLLPIGTQCSNWEMNCDAFNAATVEYFKALHNKHYG